MNVQVCNTTMLNSTTTAANIIKYRTFNKAETVLTLLKAFKKPVILIFAPIDKKTVIRKSQ